MRALLIGLAASLFFATTFLFNRVMDLAGGSLDHVIPGHDPLVLKCFPSENDIARVDLAPLVPIAQTQ